MANSYIESSASLYLHQGSFFLQQKAIKTEILEWPALNGKSIPHPSPHGSMWKSRQKDSKSQKWWMILRKQCFPDAARQMHTQVYRDPCQHVQTFTSLSWTKCQHGRGRVDMKSYPKRRSCLQLTDPGRREVLFSGMTLGILTTLQGRPNTQEQWPTQTTLHVFVLFCCFRKRNIGEDLGGVGGGQ